MLGVIVVVLGGLFSAIGLNALATSPRSRTRPAYEGAPPPSLWARRVAGVFWLVWGAGFITAAFLHLVP